MNSEKYNDLISYVTSDDRIFPNRWGDLHKLLCQEAEEKGVTEKVPVPFILNAYYAAKDVEKRQRLVDQIQFADKHGFLVKIDKFLRSLPDEDWHRCPEERINRPSAMELSADDWNERQKLVSEGKVLHKKLIEIENNSIYYEDNLGEHLSAFTMVHDDPRIDLIKLIEIFEAKIENYEEYGQVIDGYKKDYWEKDCLSTRVCIIKLKLLNLSKKHEELGGGGIYDFCEDIFLD